MKVRERGDAGQRGLPSLDEARAERKRAIVVGKVRLRSPPGQFWLWTATLIVAFTVAYWKVAQGQLESRKSQVMAKQRAISKELGPRVLPLCDRIEGWVKELAKAPPVTLVAADVGVEALRREPGVYLRLLLGDARDQKSIRTAAARSLHDGFTSCFYLRKAGPDPRAGPRCQSPADCDSGLLCNEWNVCARPEQPYNLRLLYRSLRVLSTQWTDELHEASSDLAVTARDRDLDRVTHDDVPIAIEILTRSKTFTLVLDEAPPGGVPAEAADAGGPESPAERVQGVAHPARVGIWDLQTGKPLLLLRAQAEGRPALVGDDKHPSPEAEAAMYRQSNSCALANAARGALGERD